MSSIDAYIHGDGSDRLLAAGPVALPSSLSFPALGLVACRRLPDVRISSSMMVGWLDVASLGQQGTIIQHRGRPSSCTLCIRTSCDAANDIRDFAFDAQIDDTIYASVATSFEEHRRRLLLSCEGDLAGCSIDQNQKRYPTSQPRHHFPST